MNNTEKLKEVIPSDSELKDLIINYVGKTLNPDSEEITVEKIIEVFAKQFPEFLLTLAEENWINGYTQALKDTEFVNDEKNKLHKTKTESKQ